ncbi:hypothetical protein ACF0H5_018355 [Mactra antiquata]
MHERKIHGLQPQKRNKPTLFTCDICNKTFGRRYHLTRHKTKIHLYNSPRAAQFICRHCDAEFQTYEALFQHVNQNHSLDQQGGQRSPTPSTSNVNEALNNQSECQLINSSVSTPADNSMNNDSDIPRVNNEHEDVLALRNNVQNISIYPIHDERYDVLTFFGSIRDEVRHFLNSRINTLRGIKWNLCIQVEMQRDGVGFEVAVLSPHFRSRTYVASSVEDLNDPDLNEAMPKMFASLEKFMREGSGW